jgi:hypothetical protein
MPIVGESFLEGTFIIYDRWWAGKIQLITKQNVLTHPLHHKKIQCPPLHEF